MTKSLCLKCSSLGYCRRRHADLFSDDELADACKVTTVRRFALGLNIDGGTEPTFIATQYACFNGWIRDAEGHQVILSLRPFERLDGQAFLNYFFQNPLPVDGVARVGHRGMFRTVSTILRAAYPENAKKWGVSEERTPLSA